MFSQGVQSLDSWHRYRKVLCSDCWAGCCTLPLEVSATDLIRLGLTTEDEVASSLKKTARRLEKEKWIQSFNSKTQIFVIAQKHGRDCIFLGSDRRCTVYEKRPEVCRSFPTQVGPKVGYCPYRKN